MVRSERTRARARSIRPCMQRLPDSGEPFTKLRRRDRSGISAARRVRCNAAWISEAVVSQQPGVRRSVRRSSNSATDLGDRLDIGIQLGLEMRDQPGPSLQQAAPGQTQTTHPGLPRTRSPPTTIREESSPNPQANRGHRQTPGREDPDRKADISVSNICSLHLQDPHDRIHTLDADSEDFFEAPPMPYRPPRAAPFSSVRSPISDAARPSRPFRQSAGGRARGWSGRNTSVPPHRSIGLV